MPTPPRRRWFQFGLRTLFLAVTLAALVVWQILNYRDGQVWVDVALIGGDPKTADSITRELKDHGIDCICEGSVVYGVSVHRRDKKRARKVLLESPSLKDYWIQLEPGATP